MREIKLYGHLGKKFGRSHMMDVASPAEAIRALKANFPDFESYLQKHANKEFIVRVGNESIGAEAIAMESKNKPIRITPVIGGRSGGAKLVLGAILVVAGFMTGNYYVLAMGAGMMLGGAIQMLMKPPKAGEKDEKAPSYTFNGPVNTTAQGNVVPIVYGTMLVGSQVISAGLSVEQVHIPKNTNYGNGAYGEAAKRAVQQTPWGE